MGVHRLCHNGDILLLHTNKRLVSLNTLNSSFKIHSIVRQFTFEALPYIQFSSLREIASGEPLFNAKSR